MSFKRRYGWKLGANDPVLKQFVDKYKYQESINYLIIKYQNDTEVHTHLKTLLEFSHDECFNEFLNTKPIGEKVMYESTCMGRKLSFELDKIYMDLIDKCMSGSIEWMLSLENRYKYYHLINLIIEWSELRDFYFKKIEILAFNKGKTMLELDETEIESIRIKFYKKAFKIPVFTESLNSIPLPYDLDYGF